MSSNLVTFSKLENYHITISKICNADYSSEEIDLPPLNKLKKICYSNIATKTLSPICVSILSDILRLSTEENNFTNNEITIFFTHLFNQLHDKNNTSVHTFVKYSITKVIECDAILLILQLKDCEKFINNIYELDNNSDKTEDDLNIGVSLLNCLIREDSVSEDRDHQNWLDIYGKNFMNKVIYDNEICQRVILENLRVFEDFVVRFYNDFILVNDGTFDLKNNYDDDDVLNQIDSFKHKGFIKMDKLNNLYLKLYQLDKSLLNNWFLFLQREVLSDNKFVRIIAIRMIKNLIKFDIFFTKTNEALFKLLLLRSKDSESIVRLELFKQFDKLIMNIDQINKSHSTLFLETIELGLLDINTEIRLEVVSGLPNVLNKISPKIVKIVVNLCRDKNQTIRIISCKCLCQLLQHNSEVPEEEEKIAKALLKLYYLNDFNINSQLDLFLPEYISFSLAKLNHLIELVQEDHKAKFCLFSLFTRYKPFNKFLLQYLDNILDNKNEIENTKIINWFSKFFTDMVFFTDKMTFDVVTKLRPFITGRMNIWEDENLTQFINFLKNDQNITDEKELTDFKLLIFRSTNSILDLNKFYTSLKKSENMDILVDSLITDKNCSTNLLNGHELFDIFINNLENNSDQFDINLKRLYLLKSTYLSLNLSYNSNVIKIFKSIVENEPYSMNNFIISELIPSELNHLLKNIDNKNLKTISLATFNLICHNQKTYGNLIDKFIEENLTNQLLEDEEEEDTVDGGEDDDSDVIIPDFINIFNYDETNILVKILLVIKSKENNNNSFAFYKSLVETQGNCIDIGKKVPKWWRLCIMKELLDVYLSKSIDPIYYEEFLGDSQATIQWFTIDSNKYVRRSFFNFIMQNFTELPMSVSFFIFFASEEVNINNNDDDEENNDITDEYTQFITKFVSNPKFIEERYFERLTSRFIHNLSYLPSLATIDDDEMDRLDVIRDLVEKISFFLQFVLNKENCNLILTYCNLVFNYYDKLNSENDCLYLVADIFINIINNVVSQKNWTNLKIFEENEFNKMKLPLDLFVKKENNKEVLLGGLKESLKPNEKQEIKKMCARNRSLGASSLNSTSHNNNNNINHSDVSHNATIVNTTTSSTFSSKRKRRPEEPLKKPIQYENLRKSKRNKREINYDEHDSMN